ncbi:MAG: peptidase domain-containing ABC transporter [Ardenticatenaceae bacterium]
MNEPLVQEDRQVDVSLSDLGEVFEKAANAKGVYGWQLLHGDLVLNEVLQEKMAEALKPHLKDANKDGQRFTSAFAALIGSSRLSRLEQSAIVRGVRALESVSSTFAQRMRRRAVPVILQMSAVECGAACLAMILSYYGRNTAIAECRQCFGVGRDGVTARAIAKVAQSFGLRVKAYSLQKALSDFRFIQLPAIAHWEFNHFVVIERWSPTEAEIVDPAQGRRKLTAAEFEDAFTGVVLTFEPGMQFEPRETAIHTSWVTYLGHLLRIPGTVGVLSQIIMASLFLQLVGLAGPVFTQVLIDRVLPMQMTNLVTVLTLGMGILVLAEVVTSYLRSVLLIYLSARLDSQMMLGFFEHLLSLPFSFFQERTSGDLLARLGSNSKIRDTLTNEVMSVLLDGLFVMGYLVILLLAAPTFAAFVFGMAILQIGLLQATTGRLHALTQRYLVAEAESQGYLVEALNGVATVKALGAETRIFDRWSNLFFNELNLSVERSQLSALLDAGLGTLRVLSPLVLLWLGAQQVLAGAMSIGTMLALTALASSFLGPIVSLAESTQRMQLIRAHLERLADVLEAEPEQDGAAKRRPSVALKGRIQLESVSFRYDPNQPYVLRDISLDILPGQKVALVGASGSGKSTLAKLLLGLYLPTKGDIRYDGILLKELSYRVLRSQLGVVLQESFLFSGSIRQNITFSDPGLSLKEVKKAAKSAAIHKDIKRMPMKYETLVAEGGSGLSGGQRQRLSLARALVRDPAILLLDEATSHLDVMTEREVDENLSRLTCTRIVIAHRLSTIRNADLILVLDNGQIVERGTHNNLLAQKGLYADLVHSQTTS